MSQINTVILCPIYRVALLVQCGKMTDQFKNQALHGKRSMILNDFSEETISGTRNLVKLTAAR